MCNVAFTTVHSPNYEDWYFDSGCSRHMTDNSLLFSSLEPSKTCQVTFEDGAKGNVMGKGNINYLGAPTLKDVRLVKSLLANLIRISQL